MSIHFALLFSKLFCLSKQGFETEGQSLTIKEQFLSWGAFVITLAKQEIPTSVTWLHFWRLRVKEDSSFSFGILLAKSHKASSETGISSMFKISSLKDVFFSIFVLTFQKLAPSIFCILLTDWRHFSILYS